MTCSVALGSNANRPGLTTRVLTPACGWPQTDLSNYDKQMLAACWRVAGRPADPCQHAPPSYVYRWDDTGRDHCSGRIRDGRYQPPRIQEPRLGILTPQLDDSAATILRLIERPGEPGA